MSDDCPEFLKPRLRLYLSADIIGSTALKQSRLGALGSSNPRVEASWFTTIQGFYFEAQQIFQAEWDELKKKFDQPEYFGESPILWKTIGDEVLFTKVVTDHRQVAVTLQCWMKTLDGIRDFLNRDSPGLGVKSTAWIAGFPFRNKEVVLHGGPFSSGEKIEDYYKENGRILNGHYLNSSESEIQIDYVGPSIDTGFRLTSLSTARKMVLSIDVAYILSLTSAVKGSPIETIYLRYDGQVILKGVLGGKGYPIFWLDLSKNDSAAVKEDRLTQTLICDRDAVREFCEAFFIEENDRIFPPFIDSPSEDVITEKPDWYEGRHRNLVKNFNDSYLDVPEPVDDVVAEKEDFDEAIRILHERLTALREKMKGTEED